MRTVIMTGLFGGFIVGIVLADVGAQPFGRVGATLLSPYTVALAYPIVDALARRGST